MASGTSEGFYPLNDRLLTFNSLDIPKVVPLTCHGHSRPVPHISFSSTVEDDQYYLVSACKGELCFLLQVF
jgi:serine-threonine kinase receptor-associated protein